MSASTYEAVLNHHGAPTRLKFCADVSLGKTVQGTQKSDDEKLVNYIRAASIQPYGLELDTQRMWMTEAELDKLSLCVGDILIVEGGAGYGRSVVLDQDMPGWGFQNSIVRVRSRSDWSGRFLRYVVLWQVHSGHVALLAGGATIPHFTGEKVRELLVPNLPLGTQRTIANYLDREIGEIDAMISKMGRLGELLVARRVALIQAETGNGAGGSTRLKFCADVSLGKTVQGVQKTDDEKFVNYVRAASIQSYGLELDDQRMWMSDSEVDKYDLRKDDVLIVEGGAGYGRSVVLDRDMPGWGFQNHVIRVRPTAGWDGRYLNYCVKNHLATGLIDVLVNGATIPALSSEKTRELPVPELPLAEQIRVADRLDEVTEKIDAMQADVTKLGQLLTERRAALITDVVTGKKEVA